MNKKDVILVSALINACLLALLFLLAGTPDDDTIGDPIEISQAVIETKPLVGTSFVSQPRASSFQSLDEGDNALKAFHEHPSSSTLILEEELFPELLEATEETMAQPTPTAFNLPSKDQSNVRYIEVKVKKGDTLDKIARANQSTIKAIKEANQLKTDRLSVGQTLRIPVTDKKQPSTPASSSSNSSKPALVSQTNPPSSQGTPSPEYYTVKAGDNPWKIAKQFRLKTDELLQLNNLDEERARNLKVGDRIRIR